MTEADYTRIIALDTEQGEVALVNAGEVARYLKEELSKGGGNVRADQQGIQVEAQEESGELKIGNLVFDPSIRHISISDTGELVIYKNIKNRSYNFKFLSPEGDGGSPYMCKYGIGIPSMDFLVEYLYLDYKEKYNIDNFRTLQEEIERFPSDFFNYSLEHKRPIKLSNSHIRIEYQMDGDRYRVSSTKLYGISYEESKEIKESKPTRLRIVKDEYGGALCLREEELELERLVRLPHPNTYYDTEICWGNGMRNIRYTQPNHIEEILDYFYAGSFNSDLKGKNVSIGGLEKFLKTAKYELETFYGDPETNKDYEHDKYIVKLIDIFLRYIGYFREDIKIQLAYLEKEEEELDKEIDNLEIVVNILPYVYISLRSGVPVDTITRFALELSRE